MSVLIKGMEMPTDCDNCLLFDDRFDYPSCNATGHSRGYNWNPRGQRMPDCPLIEVQEWIPVTEKLPEETGHYLAYFVSGDFEQVTWIEIVGNTVELDEYGLLKDKRAKLTYGDVLKTLSDEQIAEFIIATTKTAVKASLQGTGFYFDEDAFDKDFISNGAFSKKLQEILKEEVKV